jgi:hypothetical protein
MGFEHDGSASSFCGKIDAHFKYKKENLNIVVGFFFRPPVYTCAHNLIHNLQGL